MASSSSSSNLNSASDSHSWKYEVFISFRGEDTRKGFVDHLYTALVQQGIQTYKDDETLPRGATIGPALFKAIQESRIAVIVFSENYANSSWCLDELAHIVECMENKGQIVMPVFYDVDPSDVRKQNGKYGGAFDKHECPNKNKVDSWREALKKAGNLSGWVPKDFANGHEAICIKDIVATISNRLSPLHTNVNNNLIGIETRLQDFKSKLKIGSGGVHMVGIWGVGGGGKTTLASAAYMEISHLFEASCFLENIREESSKLGGLKTLQAKMLTLLLKKDVFVGSEIEGKSMIKRSLCHKSILVVLDDVNERKQLEALVGSTDWFGEGSSIIITTRDEHLLTLKEATIYEVSLLSDDEAIKLFSRHAFKKDEPVEDYKMLSQEVVSYASRLPLALEILGSFLYDKDKDEWKSTLAKLKCIPDFELMERLKITYDGLKHDEKELFLDIACFMRRWNIDEAMRILDSFSFQPSIGVRVLVQKSLIKVSDGKFDMHDLIEEMAHYIVRKEHPNEPEKHNRFWKEGDIVNLYAMGAAAPETEVLAFQDKNFKFWELESSDYYQRLPDFIANMKKLRWIDWAWCPTSSFPLNFQPTKLGCLKLSSSNLNQLWQGYKLLPNLKILDLYESRHLRRTPDFKGLPCLERLILEGCQRLQEIHPSIGYHDNLVLVNMRKCSSLTTFPPIMRMKKLETLNLSNCWKLKKFPDFQTNMDRLVELHLDSTRIEIIPPSVGQFCTNLVSFDLRGCFKLQSIEGNFRLLKHLKTLDIHGCCQLEKIAGDFFDEDCCLEELSLSMSKSQELTRFKNILNIIKSQYFHEDSSVSTKFPKFPRFLRKLDLSECNLGDGDIPSDLSGLLNLQELDLGCNDFSQLHSSLSRIPCLKFLNLSNCTNLVELPELPSSIAILRAEQCESLQSVGDLSNCKWLWKVSLWRKNENKLIGVERVVHSMLKKNAVGDHFMNIVLPRVYLPCPNARRLIMTLQLPHSWYNDFSGFFLCADNFDKVCRQGIVVIKLELSMDSQTVHDRWEEFDKNPESYEECGLVGYVPFGSFVSTSWSNSTYTHITFQIDGLSDPKIGLVPRKSKSRGKSIDYSKCCEEYTFMIKDDLKSSKVKILWSPLMF